MWWFVCALVCMSGRMGVTVSSGWGRFEMMRFLPTNVIVLCLCLFVVVVWICVLFKGCCMWSALIICCVVVHDMMVVVLFTRCCLIMDCVCDI